MSSRNMKSLKNIPPLRIFYNHLTKRQCSESDYFHAENVWISFEIKDLEEYTKLYSHCDVLLLAEAFFLYRRAILNSF